MNLCETLNLMMSNTSNEKMDKIINPLLISLNYLGKFFHNFKFTIRPHFLLDRRHSSITEIKYTNN